MTLELVAGRLAARQFGASLYTWTAVIGVTLAGLTIGAYLGGRIADVWPARQTISRLFGGCSAACIAAIILNNVVGEWTLLWRLGVAARVLARVTIVFFIPATLMGAVIPVAIRIALEANPHRGRIVGRMYALGSAGSILGTFLAGFWLIAALGTINTLWFIAAVMLAWAVITLPKSASMFAYAIPLALLIIAGTTSSEWAQRLGASMRSRQTRTPDILYETESQYCYIAVRQVTKQPDERQFSEDNLKNHSRLVMGRIRDLRLFYMQVYGAVTHRMAGDKKKLSTLSIGGGGYVFPRYIQEVWPGSRVDVVEIDPAVTKAATRAFGLAEDTPIRTINLDGRNYVDGLLEKKRRGEQIPQYDFVYMDAFNDMAVPFQLTTRQFNEKIFAITAANGVYIINLIDMSDSGKFLGSFVSTVRRTFPNVYVVKKPMRDDLPTNFVVIAGKQPVNLENLNAEEHLGGISLEILDENDLASLEAKAGLPILDDDHAPVENFMAPVVRIASAVEMSEKYFGQAERMNTAGNWEKAVGRYRMAAEACPAWSGRAYYLMGQILAKHGRLAEAVEALNPVLAQTDANSDRVTAASLHYNIGTILKEFGDAKGASRHLAGADELLRAELAGNDGPAEIFWYLGRVQTAIGNKEEATLNFEEAVKKDPNEVLYHLSVAEAFARQKQYDKAIQRLKESTEYMLIQGRKDDAEQLKELMRRLETENRK